MIGSTLRIRYEVTQVLWENPIFAAYAARDRVEGRPVCVRVLKQPYAAERQFVERVMAWVERMAGVQHPGIERLQEMDDDEGLPFIVGEMPRGTPLSDRIKKLAPFSVPVSVATAISLCDALSVMHRAGIVHGDVGPHNALVNSEGDTVLLHGGLWQTYAASESAGAAVLPAMAPYLAPEVSMGGMPSPASDVYSVGAVLFELLTGRAPYLSDSIANLVEKHQAEPTPSLRSYNPSAPVALEQVLKKALAKSPGERYGSAGDMLSDLRMIQDALRFGKPLNWPLSGGAEAEELEPPRVAPKMSAVQPESRKPSKGAKPTKVKKLREDPDVPRWIQFLVVFFMGIATFFVIWWIVFNTSKPREVTVPELKRLTRSEAEERLKSLKLNLRVVRQEVSETTKTDTILDMDPPAGSKVREGGDIRVIISLGSRFVEVPDIRGMTLDKAKVALSTLGLELDDRPIQVRDKNVEEGQIVSQNPEARQRVEKGTRIRPRVSIGNRRPESGETAAKYVFTMRIRLSGITEAVEVRVDMVDAEGPKTVYEGFHEPEELVELTAEGYGEQVLFKIYYNDELVKQVTRKPDEVEQAETP